VTVTGEAGQPQERKAAQRSPDARSTVHASRERSKIDRLRRGDVGSSYRKRSKVGYVSTGSYRKTGFPGHNITN